jgi:hypothetical protein
MNKKKDKLKYIYEEINDDRGGEPIKYHGY